MNFQKRARAVVALGWLLAIDTTTASESSRSVGFPVLKQDQVKIADRVEPVCQMETATDASAGVVTILALVGRDGAVASVRIDDRQPLGAVAVAAADAVAQWRFDPRAKDGQQAPFVVKIVTVVKIVRPSAEAIAKAEQGPAPGQAF